MKSERELIRLIAALAGKLAPAPANSAVVQGIGDDCAVLRLGPGSDTLITTDLFVEGVHFRREWLNPAVLGALCLRRGVSDVYAMGGEPVAAFLSLGLPENTDEDWLEGFIAGFASYAKIHQVTLSGGDTGTSPDGVFADVTVLGRVPTGKAVLRSGATPGEALYVTGALGESAQALADGKAWSPFPYTEGGGWGVMIPERGVGIGTQLRAFTSAMIDVSDGLSTDLAHICEESGVGAILYAPAIPLPQRLKPDSSKGSTGTAEAVPLRKKGGIGMGEAVPIRETLLEYALHGGEDYELLFTAPRNKKLPSQIAGVPITRIGEITADKGKMFLVDERGRMKRLEPKGWEHFTSRGRPKAARGAGKRGRR